MQRDRCAFTAAVSGALNWDNVGLLVGDAEKEVHTVYIALDATDETIAEAVEAGADLLLTHHPLIFKGIRQVNSEDFVGRRVMKLIRHDIAYYAMHTNFDVAAMGTLAAERLGLWDAVVLQETGTAFGIGQVGRLPREMTLSECAEHVKESFGLDQVKVFGCTEGLLQRVAVCPGSGKSVINDALEKGAQALITGDIDHHEGIDAVARGMAVIDAGHYGLEKIFIPYMKRYLEERQPKLTVEAQAEKQPFLYI